MSRRFTYSAKPTACLIGLLCLLLTLNLAQSASAGAPQQIQRLSGADRYATAAAIAAAGWTSASAVVLARGDDFPDALAGAVLAAAPQVQGPMLLTQTAQLPSVTWEKIQSLGAQTVYLLGGPGAIAPDVENFLTAQGLHVLRLAGADRYATAARIAVSAVPSASEAFLASGASFPDALSVSSYAAARQIPLLLSEQARVPQATLDALQELGVRSVTLVGGSGVLAPAVQSQLEALGLSVRRLSGSDRYLTNDAVIQGLAQDASVVYTATGEDFPDALTGAALAARANHPILLIPPVTLPQAAADFLQAQITNNFTMFLLGGTGVISSEMENTLRTGSADPRISLQYIQAESYSGALTQLSRIPGDASQSVDILSPNWYTLSASAETKSDGTLGGSWDTSGSHNYAQYVAAVHGRNLKIMPLVGDNGSNASIDRVLSDPAARTKLAEQIMERVRTTGIDGVILDFEIMRDDQGPNLTALTRDLYTRLHEQNKLLGMAVMSRTSPTAEPWLEEFNYHDLAQYVDYLHIMTYDYSWDTPGPISPLSWIRKVLEYTQSQGVPMRKVLLGVPYYGRDWAAVPATDPSDPAKYSRSALGSAAAVERAAAYGAEIQRDGSGIPYYRYTDEQGTEHQVYFEDALSWEYKLQLIREYDLGGVGAWSLYWVSDSVGDGLFPLLQRYLR
ncbi:MAG: cell wall-binding repeat-containing protein [Peptococcaceae bacterium]|nr:cell wall-binding repeat-containing protein [Peptococcaceae bacterium]